LHQDLSLLQRVLRDLVSESTQTIRIDSAEQFKMLQAFGQDPALRQAMGSAFCAVYEAVKQQEWLEWQAAVTDWETRRYGTWC
jgi:glutamine synthetase